MESRRSEKKNSKKIIRKAMIAKKLTALGMAVVLVFSLAACGAADNGKLSSDTVKLKAAAMGDENVYKERVLGCPVGWEDCVQKFSVQLFQQAYAQQSGADRDNQDKADAAQSGSGFVLSPASVLTALLNASYKKGKPDLNVLFQYNMPLRALAKMTNGAISMGMVDGIVMEVQGFWVIGLVRVIFEAVKNVILNAQLENRLRNS